MTGSPVIRSRPRPVRGVLVPAFIHNVDYHLANLGVYADGVVDCWGRVDLNLFRCKVAGGWVVAQPPVGSTVTLRDLGKAVVAEARWAQTADDLIRAVETAVRELNPAMVDLVDLGGEECELRAGIRWSKLADLGPGEPYRTDSLGQDIRGARLPLFAARHGGPSLVDWELYADGYTRLDEGPLSRPERVIRMLEQGKATTSVPDDTQVTLGTLGSFCLRQGQWWIEPGERIREAADCLDILAGKPGTVRVCKDAYGAYRRNPTPEARSALRKAYEAVPRHRRAGCGDIDSKDWWIRQALYGKTPPGHVEEDRLRSG